MSPLMKKRAKRERLIQSLSFAAPAERSDARKALRSMTNARQWTRREQHPGNFHIPDGRQRMPAWNDAR